MSNNTNCAPSIWPPVIRTSMDATLARAQYATGVVMCVFAALWVVILPVGVL